MPKFRSAFSDRVRCYCCSGSREFPIFELNEKGDVVDTGKKENVWDKIQSFEDEVLLKNIIRRCGLTGETLEAKLEAFGDSTVLPKSLLELKQSQDRIQGFVDSLSKSDLDLLNDKGFDEFISVKIAEKLSNQSTDSNTAKEGDKNE